MDYKKHYNNLINTRLEIKEERITLKKEGIYFERHHIIPKSQGGTWNKENIVLLTAREHFIAHWLLSKIDSSKSNIHAFWKMCISNNTPKKYKFSSIAYEEARVNFSNKMKGHKINLGHKHSEETIKKMSKTKLGKTFSNETKNKISQNKLGKKQNRKKHIIQYNLDGVIIKEWNSCIDINKELGYCKKKIYNCINKKIEHYNNFKWQYN